MRLWGRVALQRAQDGWEPRDGFDLRHFQPGPGMCGGPGPSTGDGRCPERCKGSCCGDPWLQPACNSGFSHETSLGAAGARLHLQRGLPRFALHLCLSHGTEALQYSCAAETALTWKKENLPVRARYSEIAHLGLLKPKFE